MFVTTLRVRRARKATIADLLDYEQAADIDRSTHAILELTAHGVPWVIAVAPHDYTDPRGSSLEDLRILWKDPRIDWCDEDLTALFGPPLHFMQTITPIVAGTAVSA